MKRITLAAAIVLMAIMGLTAQTSSWNTLGNNIQTPSIYTYFLGTTNSYPLRFRTNNTDSARSCNLSDSIHLEGSTVAEWDVLQ